MIECSFFKIVVANWRLDNAKSPTAMLQAKTARTPHTNSSDGTYTRSHAVRTYIPQVGYLFSSLDMLAVCTKEKAQHGTAAPRKQ